MEAERQRALTDFYREEFLRHLAQLELIGVVNDDNRAVVDRARRTLFSNLDAFCGRSDFPAMAETLLQKFAVLSQFGELDPRQAH